MTTRPTRPALVASAVRIRLSAKPPPRKTFEWQNEAWTAYEVVGEIQHAIDFIANHVSKVYLFGALVPPDSRTPPAADDASIGAPALASLRTRGGEYSELLRELTINLFVAGECYLVGRGGAENQVDYWEILSTDELQITNDRFLIRDYPSGPTREFTDADAIVIRIAFAHPRWGGLPISPLRGILSSADEIQRIERVIRGAAKSRSAGPGLLLVPDEASFGSLDPTAESSDPGQTPADPFISALMEGMLEPIQDEGSPAAVVPLIVRAPADVLKEVRRLSLAVDVDTELIKLDRALTRLAQGLPLPPEIVTGKSGLSHWTAFSVDESTVTAYIEPVLKPIVNALTLEWYRPFLVASGMSETDARSRQLWFDVTALVTRPNRSADADFGLEHIAISDAEWRKVKGFTEEGAPTPLERLARLLLQRGSLDPISTVTLLQVLGIVPRDSVIPTNIQIPPTPSATPAPPATSNDPPDRTRPKDSAPPRRSAAALIALPPATRNDDHISLQLSELDHDLRIRLHTVAEAAVSRALERASASIISQLRNRSRYTTLLRGIPKLEAASAVGRPALEGEGIEPASLFVSAFDSLSTKFRDWTARAYAKASRILSIPIPTPIDLISSAADNLVSALTSYSIDRLFDPSRPLDPFGEVDATLTLPHSLVRQALYRAGGGTELLPSDASPPCGISTGSNVLRAVMDAGGMVEGWEWCYSAAVRTRDFEPHAALNGVRFSSFSDPILRNTGTWPPVSHFYPSDHEHCACYVRPLLRLPDIDTPDAADPSDVEAVS